MAFIVFQCLSKGDFFFPHAGRRGCVPRRGRVREPLEIEQLNPIGSQAAEPHADDGVDELIEADRRADRTSLNTARLKENTYSIAGMNGQRQIDFVDAAELRKIKVLNRDMKARGFLWPDLFDLAFVALAFL
jgi:hypothetical protein